MNLNLTNTGQQLLTRALAGDATIQFSHIALGSGVDAGASASALSHQEMLLAITSSTRGQQTVRIKTAYNNVDVQVGYRLTEIGIYAANPDGGSAEVLYAYGYAPQAAADYVPAAADRTLETELTIAVYVGTAERVEVMLDSGSYALASDLEAHIGDMSNPHGVTAAQVGAATAADHAAHISDTSNPHNVTAAQIGAASAADLTTHTGDTSNPHGVTPEQIGAATAEDLAQLREDIAQDIDALPKAAGSVVIGTTAAGHTEADCDILCHGDDEDVLCFRQAVEAAGNGGKIVVLPGEYRLVDELDITQDGLEITGSKAAVVAIYGVRVAKHKRSVFHGNTLRLSGKGIYIHGLTLCAAGREGAPEIEGGITISHPYAVLAIDGDGARVDCDIWRGGVLVGGADATVETSRFAGGAYLKVGGWGASDTQLPLPVYGNARGFRVRGNTFTRCDLPALMRTRIYPAGDKETVELVDTAIDARNACASAEEGNAVYRAGIIKDNVVSTPDANSIVVMEGAEHLIVKDNICSGDIGQQNYHGDQHYIGWQDDAARLAADNITTMNTDADAIPDAHPPLDPLKTWAGTQLWLRAGQLGQVLEPGDQLNVEVGGTARDFDVLGLDEDVPVNADLRHVLSIQAHAVLNNLPFDPPMYLFAVTEAACQYFGWPSTGANAGMPAGTYNITLLHGASDESTTQDGTYQFTTTQLVPIGGGIRHSVMGASSPDGQYTKGKLLEGTFLTYSADTITTIETDIATTEGSGGTGLGTTTAKDPQYKSGDYINFTRRQANGCNRLSWSYFWQYLNSDNAMFQWKPKSIWSRNVSSSSEGFLHSIDPALRQVIGKVRKRVVLSIADGGGYEDLEGFCFPSFMVDLGLGANDGVIEGPVDADGTVVRTEAYTLWNGASSTDRIKFDGGGERAWWLGSALPSGADNARFVTASGARSSNYARTASGIVPSLFIV